MGGWGLRPRIGDIDLQCVCFSPGFLAGASHLSQPGPVWGLGAVGQAERHLLGGPGRRVPEGGAEAGTHLLHPLRLTLTLITLLGLGHLFTLPSELNICLSWGDKQMILILPHNTGTFDYSCMQTAHLYIPRTGTEGFAYALQRFKGSKSEWVTVWIYKYNVSYINIKKFE